jgi:hypothetical protein
LYVTDIFTSDQPHRIALKTNKQPRKGQNIAHINICSLRNKVHKIDTLLTSENINILSISETHLDNPFDDPVKAIHGYSIYRKDMNANGESVATVHSDPLTFSRFCYITALFQNGI